MKTLYVAEDGEIFDNKEDYKAYEHSIFIAQVQLKWILEADFHYLIKDSNGELYAYKTNFDWQQNKKDGVNVSFLYHSIDFSSVDWEEIKVIKISELI